MAGLEDHEEKGILNCFIMKIKSILSEILGLTVTTLLEYFWYYHEVLLMALFCAV